MLTVDSFVDDDRSVLVFMSIVVCRLYFGGHFYIFYKKTTKLSVSLLTTQSSASLFSTRKVLREQEGVLRVKMFLSKK